MVTHMDIDLLVDWGFDFYAHNQIFCLVAGGVLLILVLWKPLKVLKTAFLVLILLAILYAAFFLIDSMKVGVQVKEHGVQRMEKSLE